MAVKFTVRLAEDLKAKVDEAVKLRKRKERGYSLNKFMAEAAAQKIAGIKPPLS